MNHTGRKMKLVALLMLFLISASAVGCKTGKGCDCPTFGKNDTQKINRF